MHGVSNLEIVISYLIFNKFNLKIVCITFNKSVTFPIFCIR
jgi:hypothetical protein